MADPTHQETLDGFDRLTVILYRTGLSTAAIGLAAGAITSVFAPQWLALSWFVTTASVALAASSIHLYDRVFRWIFSAMAWLGLVLQLGAMHVPPALTPWVWHAGLGFLFATLSAFALKERFCFRIPGLRWVPLLLASSLPALVLDGPEVAAIPIGLSSGLLGVLTIAKWRMPLHFDIGDRSKYQI